MDWDREDVEVTWPWKVMKKGVWLGRQGSMCQHRFHFTPLSPPLAEDSLVA
jgi:hypothetical protein